VKAHEATRILELEHRVAELAERVENIVDKLARLTQVVRALSEELRSRDGAATAAAPALAELSGPMKSVLQLVYQGELDEAQRRLYELPEAELAAQPAVVALVAAALFVQRGDLNHALQALSSARELTDDERLLHVIQLVEDQTSG
jgi:uncharacterized coiled-coil protein SlyX